MTTPIFLEYTEADHAEARGKSKYVADMLAWLEWEAFNAVLEVAEFAKQDRLHEAKLSAGRMTAFRDVISAMHKADPKPVEPEPEFVDPNMPARARRS